MNEIVEKQEVSQLQTLKPQQDQLPQINGQSSGLMNLVERMATDKEIDPSRVEQAFEMYMKVRAMDAEAAFNDAMSRAQSEMQNVVANMRNTHTGKNYGDLSAIHEKCKPVWTKHGLSVSSLPKESAKENHIRVVTNVRHAFGHKETIEFDYPLDTVGSAGKVNKTPIQGMGSSMEYGRRYQELLFFDIAIAGKDDDGGVVGEPISADQAAEMKAELQRTNSNVGAFLKFVGAKDVDSMTESQYQKGKAMLDQKAKKAGGK